MSLGSTTCTSPTPTALRTLGPVRAPGLASSLLALTVPVLSFGLRGSRARSSPSQCPLVAGPRDMRLVQRDGDSRQTAGPVSEPTRARALGKAVGDHLGQSLRRRVHPG